jgi:diacylglycerol O-acyltransferase
VSLLFNGQGINITLTSYQDRIDVGIIACRDTVPHVQRLLDFFEAALAELE